MSALTRIVCCVGLVAVATALAQASPLHHTVRSLRRIEGGARVAPFSRWQVQQTANFRIFHAGSRLAESVGRHAERLRTLHLYYWSGKRPTPWSTACDLYIYPTTRQLIVMTGGQVKAGSSQVRPARLSPGQILSRRVNLAADDPELLGGTLPHEIMHLVVGDLALGEAPLWLNEGLAVTAESETHQRRYVALAARAVRRASHFALLQLMRLRHYPEATALFYAQSASLVRFLVSKRPRALLVALLRRLRSDDPTTAVRAVYGLTVAQLEREWLTFARAALKR